MKASVAVLVAAVCLGACGAADKSPDASPQIRERGVAADPVVMAERRASGRWRSEAGILPGDPRLWVILDVAGDGSLRVERRGMSDRREAVYAMASGKVKITPEGMSAQAPDADGSLLPFRDFTATFPSPAKMLVRSGERTFVFRYSDV